MEARSVTCHQIEPVSGFAAAADALRAVVEGSGPIDAVVVASTGGPWSEASIGWRRTLDEHRGVVAHIHADAGWARAAADYAAAASRPVQLVTLTDATTTGGRSRAQAAAQHARVAASATEERVTAFAVSIEVPDDEAARPTGALVAHLLSHPEATALSGAELAVGHGWLGIRSHPRPIGSVTFGGPSLPVWLDGTLREIVGADGDPRRGKPR